MVKVIKQIAERLPQDGSTMKTQVYGLVSKEVKLKMPIQTSRFHLQKYLKK